MRYGFDYNIILFVLVLCCNSGATLDKGDKCVLKDGREGQCKPVKECPTTLQLIKQGVFPVMCGLEETKIIVCCKVDEEGTNSTTTTNPVTSRTPGDISKQKCKEYAEYAYKKIQPPTLLLYPHITKKLMCDISTNRLVMGTSLAARNEFPHMAILGYKPKPDDEVFWYCGGSLISENFVLTSASTTFTYVGFPKYVRVGFTNKSDPAYMQERTVSEIIPYPEYDHPNRYHDIGLLRLSKNVILNNYARPACLQTEKFIPAISAIASGWSSPTYDQELSNDLLAKVMEFYSLDTCRNIYSARPDLKDGIIDDFMFCAGNAKSLRSTCNGDGGGPLQVYHQETETVKCMYDIIGVISFGKICGTANDNSNVFTRVSAYIKWIEDTVWPN